MGTAVGDLDSVGLKVGKPPRSPFVEVSCNDWGPLETAELPRTSSRRQWASLSSPVTSTSQDPPARQTQARKSTAASVKVPDLTKVLDW